MKKNKIKNFIIYNPYRAILFFPFAPTLIFIFLFIYTDLNYLSGGLIFFLGGVASLFISLPWLIYCFIVGKNKLYIHFFGIIVWVFLFLLLGSFTFSD